MRSIDEILADAVSLALRWRAEGRSDEEILSTVARVAIEAVGESSPPGEFPLIGAADFLSRADERVEYLVDGVLGVGGMSVMAGKPKVGKSTLARALAVAVARGEPFLGRATKQGPVFYLALEDREAEIREQLKRLGLTAGDPAFFYVGRVPEKAVKRLLASAERKKPALIVVDTLQRLVRLRDMNDYAQVTLALDPLLGIVRDTQAHIMLLHHSPKTEREYVGDEVLGSTAILASADTGIAVKRSNDDRTFQTMQRYGQDIPATVFELDEGGHPRAVGTRSERRKGRIRDEVLALLEDGPRREADIRAGIEANTATVGQELRNLVNEGIVQRNGAGKRNDPHVYSVAVSRSPVRALEGKRENEERGAAAQAVITAAGPSPNGSPGIVIRSDGRGEL